ncbi:asparagine synthase (glutamine-hydrolyzing) [Bradyrhizobium retamae]|nr:asparagine synthase (glutamine-hydrolyzing) [Bradyrhizobium retamae]
MCGIVGWLNVDLSADAAERTLQRMCSSIEYRGPDDDGMFFDQSVGLGMRRLSIVDVAGGHQPISSDDGALQLVFNGEIYNHDELRRRLASRGAQFKTRSDTEVILRTYEFEGLNGFKSFNGMFAIALWDGRSRTLHLVRDRLGVKPLYYAVDGKKVVFASEVKAILASQLVDREVNTRALWDFITCRYVPAPETIWLKVFKLKPGHWLSLKHGESASEPRRWWDVPTDSVSCCDKDEEAVDQFTSLFENAVDLRMVADVPVGILLSGGLDSSAVAAAAARKGARVETFSVAFEGAAEIDERGYARSVAAHLGTKHHEVVIGSREFIEFLPRLTHLTDEPLADLASVPLFYVNKLARQSVKVVLSGEGSDEIFGGYTFDRWVAQWDSARERRWGAHGGPLRSWSGRALRAFSRTRIDPVVETDLRRLSEPLVMTNLASTAEKERWFRQPVVAPDSLQRVRDDLSRIGEQDPLNQALYVYCQDWLVEDLLMKADRMSMANSVELRTPFLDYRLVEWAWRLAPRLKVGRDAAGRYATKLILRKYAQGRLPGSVIDRPKMGFPVPVYGWLSNQLSGWASDVLGGDARVRTWFRDEAINELLTEGIDPEASTQARHRLWNLLVLEHWMQSWKA